MIDFGDLVEFYDAPAAGSFTLPPAQAIAFFKAKGLKVTFDWRDMIGAEHANAFTIAKMADLDLLADIQASLDDALASGLSYRTWADSITPLLQSKGWWGRQAVTDPLTGETLIKQLGSPGRLQTIFRTNVQSAYAVGAWDQIQANKVEAPYLLYDAVDDHRTRPEHAEWDGTVLPVDHEWWASHYPPNGWNCRCGTIQVSEEDLADLGLAPSTKAPGGGTYDWTNPRTGKSMKVPKGLDPGWNVNQGKVRLDQLQALAMEKVKAMNPATAKAAAKGLKAAGAQATAHAEQAGITVAPEIEKPASAIAKGAGKAQLRQAKAAIDDALKANTPYLAKAIQKIQASKAGQAMDPIEQLAAAQAEATKVKDSAALANWKQAQLAGKPGPAAGKAVFDALPEPAQAALQAEIDAKTGAAAAQAAIKAELEAIESGAQGPLPKANLAAVKAAKPDASPADLLEAVKALPDKLTAGQQAGGLAGWKKNAIAGKPPTDKQQLAFDSLTDKQKAYQLAQVDAAKAAQNAAVEAVSAPEPVPAPAAAAPPTPTKVKPPKPSEVIPPGPAPISDAVPDINPGKMVQTGPQKGSNPGGTYIDQATGTEWYVKFPSSADAARNEVLGAKIYALAGIDVPDLRLITWPDGRTAVASRMEAGLTKGTPAALAKGGAFDGFGVDAWLANWDVAGATMDNLLVKGGRAFRVDTGGALRYRAQGGLKGSAWSDDVPEIQSLRNTGTAPQAAKVFGKMTPADIEASVARVLAIDEDEIRKLLVAYGPTEATDRLELFERLKARRADLARQYPGAAPKAKAIAEPVDAPDTARVTAREQADIEAARVNGYGIRTDADEIEDQSVLVSVLTTASGKKVTRVFLKVRGRGAATLDAQLPQSIQAAKTVRTDTIDFSTMRADALSLVKSVNARAAKGEVLAPHVIEKWTKLRGQMLSRGSELDDALEQGVIDFDTHRKATTQVTQMRALLEKHIPPKVAIGAEVPKATPQLDFGKLLPDIAIPPRAVAAPARVVAKAEWKRVGGPFRYQAADFDKSNARLSGKADQLVDGVNEHAVLEGDGYHVTYIPDTASNAISSRGMVMIDIDGSGAGASARGFEILEKIGVKATRSSQAEKLELYLDRIAHIRTLNNNKLEQAYAAAAKIADPTARAQAKLQLLNADVGRDMTKSRYWNPDGERQAFGHGRVIFNRPDLDDAEVAAFSKTHRVYTSVAGLSNTDSTWSRLKSILESGGQIGSQIDRMRRGVKRFGSSVEEDHRTGGANYIFTRLKSRTSKKEPGIYWNAEALMRRTDTVTFTGDKFGNVDRGVHREYRRTDPAGWREAAARGGNETDFRDSLSVFDGVERVVFKTREEYNEAIGGMRAMGYRTWPDGRALEDVLDYVGSSNK